MDKASMICEGCGRPSDWTPYGRCSWECYDQDRSTERDQQAMIDAAPEAFAFFMGLAPGRRIDSPE
ncbi:YdeI/OmpD-associated family protein [Streptomyces kaniharaensis]|uniref:YdeI/OmpD-associated family protein n=1 Tax=Streptomyces kaniharaensis TaxID=212423 RepID=A0A6N7L209_9ACTN|nr:hypothetical protein [Streptomyces kaniharaensis]MQS17641.1 YdeI/OmpD-associated family protein [Streptomyces kaniharaensis]